jgi:hypothetical protein
MQCNVEFRYQLSICSGTKENHGKPPSMQQLTTNSSRLYFGTNLVEDIATVAVQLPLIVCRAVTW